MFKVDHISPEHYAVTTSTTYNMNISNYLLCYFTSREDYNHRETVNPNKAIVATDNDGRLNYAYFLPQLPESQNKQEIKEFILWHAEQI